MQRTAKAAADFQTFGERYMKQITLSIVTFMCLTLPAFATDEVANSNGQRILESLLPIVIIFTIVFVLVRRFGKRNEPYMERAKVHMDRIEQQNEEIISLLKDIKENKKDSEPSNAV